MVYQFRKKVMLIIKFTTGGSITGSYCGYILTERGESSQACMPCNGDILFEISGHQSCQRFSFLSLIHTKWMPQWYLDSIFFPPMSYKNHRGDTKMFICCRYYSAWVLDPLLKLTWSLIGKIGCNVLKHERIKPRTWRNPQKQQVPNVWLVEHTTNK